MVSQEVSLILLICGGVFLLIDVLLFFVCCWWWRRKKKENERCQKKPEYMPLCRSPGPLDDPPTTRVTTQTSITDFKIPTLNERNRKLKEIAKPSSILASGLDPIQYGEKQRVTMKNKPKLGFTFCYDFRSTQLKITLKGIKNIQKYMHEQIMVTILMSHTKVVYHSSKVDGPDAVFSEEYPFPLDSMEISSDPPITAKFNVWHIEKNARKTPYGFVQVNVEDVLSSMNNITPESGKTVWRNVLLSQHLTDEGLEGELLITLSYLSASQRIGCTIVRAKDLILTANDRDLYVKITLLCRGEEQQSVVTNYTQPSQNPEFSQEFIFRFADLRIASIDGIGLRLEIIARQTGLLSQPRVLGGCILGHSSAAERTGKEHWVTTLTSPKSVTQWHQIKELNKS